MKEKGAALFLRARDEWRFRVEFYAARGPRVLAICKVSTAEIDCTLDAKYQRVVCNCVYIAV